MIPATEQHWLSESFVDPNGRLFEWRGELYRALDPVYAARWQQWAKSGVIDGLVRDGLLIESEWSGLKTDSGKAVLHHRRVAVQSYCYEWPPAMLLDAALLTIDLCIRLAEHGLTLQDGHPWNILFEGTKPIYVDAGSIVPARDDILWAPYQQFCNFFLYPLYLYAAGQDHIARWLMRDYLSGVSDGDLLAALPASFKLRHPRRTLGVAVPKAVSKLFAHLPEDLQQRFLSISKTANSGPGQVGLKLKFFTSLRKNIEGLELKHRTSHWARYYGNPDKQYFQTDLSPGDWQSKYQAVGNTLTDIRPKSVLDVGANTGRYSALAAAHGARVTACEADTAALALCHETARANGLNILPLAVNVFSTAPTPGRGGIACPGPIERFKSDLVMGLAVVHHVVALQRLPIARICELFAALTERWLLLEFVPALKPRIGASVVPCLDDYTVEAMENCLKAHFAAVKCQPSFPPERKLFLCEK
jgi:SAM-dependent methyltransferase